MEYTGYVRKEFSTEELSKFYSDQSQNYEGLKENQYLLLEHNGEVVDKYIFQKRRLQKVNFSIIHSQFMGDIKPRNSEQELAFHMLQDKASKIKVLTGRYGSGKSMAMIASALERIKDGEFQKLVYVRNNIGVRDTMELGSLPGLT